MYDPALRTGEDCRKGRSESRQMHGDDEDGPSFDLAEEKREIIQRRQTGYLRWTRAE